MAEQVKPYEIYRRIIEQYGSSCINHASFYLWVEKFANVRYSVDNEIQITLVCKVLFIVFWDMKSVILCHYHKDRSTMNSELYWKVLKYHLRPEILQKQGGYLTKEGIFQQNNSTLSLQH